MVYGGNIRPSGGVSQIRGNVKTNLLSYRYAKASLCVKPIFSECNTMSVMYSQECYSTIHEFVCCTIIHLQVLPDRNAIQVKVKMYYQQKILQ